VRIVNGERPLEVALHLMVVSGVHLEQLIVGLDADLQGNAERVAGSDWFDDSSDPARGRDGPEEEAAPPPGELHARIAGVHEFWIFGGVHEGPRACADPLIQGLFSGAFHVAQDQNILRENETKRRRERGGTVRQLV